MAKYCSNCGHELRDTDMFCSECATPVGEAAVQAQPHTTTRTEYHDVTIPLNIRITRSQARQYGGGSHSEQAAAAQADPIIIQYLELAQKDGWEPEGPTIFTLLYNLQRVRYKATYSWVNSDWKYSDYFDVTIRVRRVAP